VSGLEVALPGRASKAVPGADDLAIVATEHPIADQRAQFFRDRALEFDGQVGNTASRIQYIGADEGCRGADIQARGAASAVLTGMGRVDGQGEVDEQLAEEEETPGLAIQHQGVLADPAEAGLFGDGLFQYRGAVDESAEAERADGLLNALGQLLDAFADQLVVIAPQGVARDVGFFRFVQQLGHVRVTGQIVHAQGYYAQCAGHQLIRMRTFAAVGGHVIHLAVVTGVQPALQVLFMLGQVQAADADLLKAQLTPPVLDRLGKGEQLIAAECEWFGINSRHAEGETDNKMRIILPDIGADRRMLDTKPHLPDALYDAAQVRDLDARLIAAGTPGLELMQRAAHATWRALRRRWPQARSLSVLAGRGNNAGDGYLVALLARKAGWQVCVLAVGDPAVLSGDAATAYANALAGGVDVQRWAGQALNQAPTLILDALLGTGLSGDVRQPYADAIAAINASGQPVIAVDIPSGLSADTGRVLGVAVRAELTVTFIGLKLGLFTGEAKDRVGELAFDDLQADPLIVVQTQRSAIRLDVRNLPPLAARSPTAHKGLFGRVLVLGGNHGFGGAALLSSESALRSGAGMVTLATREEHVAAALSRCPEIMTVGVRSANQVQGLIDAASVLVVGPGLGQASWSRSLLSAAVNAPRTQVWDADALNQLAAGWVSLPAGCVITPHPGEAARLLGIDTAAVQADRPAAARALAHRFKAVCVLKGSGSLIADSDGRLALCDRGHPAMATAGLGDVLAGLIGALLAQKMNPFEAACLGVWLHARAGEKLGQAGRGLAASDLIPAIRQLLEEQQPCLS